MVRVGFDRIFGLMKKVKGKVKDKSCLFTINAVLELLFSRAN